MLRAAARLEGRRTGLRCGRSDEFLPTVRELTEAVSGGHAVADFDLWAHTRRYGDRITPAALAFAGDLLSAP